MDDMSDTLDRLKALNSKLEAKLSEKQRAKSKETAARKTVEPTGEEKTLPQKEEKTEPDKTPSVVEKPKGAMPAAVESSEALQTLAQRLYAHLEVDRPTEAVRARNLERLAELYLALEIGKKVERIEDLFIYKAMNISGIGLKEEDFGEIREGKYVQVIAITYEPDKNGKKKAKNISLGYFGKAETLDPVRKNQVIEFVLRWRYEKAFQNLEHYRALLAKVEPRETLF
jgi:hypothetical protein